MFGSQSIYHDLEAIKDVALSLSKEHDCNYNVIVSRPLNGEYNRAHGSTYEFVADSYLVNRPNTVILMRTDDVTDQNEDRGECTQPTVVSVGDPSSGRSESLVRALGIAAHTGTKVSCMSAEDYHKQNAKHSFKTRGEIKTFQDSCLDDFIIPSIDFTSRGIDKPDNSKFYDRFYHNKRKR